jgi:hypothetical protein
MSSYSLNQIILPTLGGGSARYRARSGCGSRRIYGGLGHSGTGNGAKVCVSAWGAHADVLPCYEVGTIIVDSWSGDISRPTTNPSSVKVLLLGFQATICWKEVLVEFAIARQVSPLWTT